jgi:hypothetical protein
LAVSVIIASWSREAPSIVTSLPSADVMAITKWSIG